MVQVASVYQSYRQTNRKSLLQYARRIPNDKQRFFAQNTTPKIHRIYSKIRKQNKLKMTWEPQPEGLQQIITILKESQSPDNATQRAVHMVSANSYN